jgi:hypothetical protein
MGGRVRYELHQELISTRVNLSAILLPSTGCKCVSTKPREFFSVSSHYIRECHWAHADNNHTVDCAKRLSCCQSAREPTRRIAAVPIFKECQPTFSLQRYFDTPLWKSGLHNTRNDYLSRRKTTVQYNLTTIYGQNWFDVALMTTTSISGNRRTTCSVKFRWKRFLRFCNVLGPPLKHGHPESWRITSKTKENHISALSAHWS